LTPESRGRRRDLMSGDELFSHVYGCMMGSAIGDAFGGPVEGAKAHMLQEAVGSDWVEELIAYPFDYYHMSVWEEKNPPRGTATDDTRSNHIFAEAVIDNKGFINSRFLAMEYIDRYRHPERYYKTHPEMARRQYRGEYLAACAYLGMRELPADCDPWVLMASGTGLPYLWGLISLAFAGLLYVGEPEKAYKKAFELAYRDLGYARDATAMMAAMISAAIAGEVDAKGMVQVGLETNPFGYGGGANYAEYRWVAHMIEQFLEFAEDSESDRELVYKIAPEVSKLYICDPRDILGTPATAVHYTDGDFRRSLAIAANDRWVDAEGNFTQLRDVDCTAGVAGALVGALNGIEALPDDWVADTLDANKKIYDIDIEKNAHDFYEAVYGQ
jgi:hypothetical protein